jgi:UDP-N-acetylmuramoyl-L-alanyl-D-glutamate--2,6-diaminopimelate ligase
VPLLSELMANAFPDASLHGQAQVEISHITTDSRAVKAGSLFAAMPGVNADGAKYIPEALRAGASAILMAANSRSDVVSLLIPMKLRHCRQNF